MTVPRILFAHGAGVPSRSPWMRRYAERMGHFARIETFDYPYMVAGRRSPDPLPRLIEAHRGALAPLREGEAAPLFLAGKSMGGRVACHVALVEPVMGVVCFGYPLRGQNGKLRDQVLLELSTPVLFVQGTRDPLCPLADLEGVRERMRAPNELFVVEGGDHSLELLKGELGRQGTTQTTIEERVCERVRRFVEERVASGVG